MTTFKFKNFDLIYYGPKVLTNFMECLDLDLSTDNNYFYDYIIRDGQTAESISYKLYNDASLEWIILYINNTINPFFDWPLLPNELLSYCHNKYGDNVYGVHHYEKNGFIVNQGSSDKTISNFEYETQLNDSKRNIKIPTEEFINDFKLKYGELF